MALYFQIEPLYWSDKRTDDHVNKSHYVAYEDGRTISSVFT